MIEELDETKCRNRRVRWSVAAVLLAGALPASASSGWAVGSNGTILNTSNNGGVWSTQNSGTSTLLSGVSFVDPIDGWAVGPGGVIVHTNNGGVNWSPQTSGTSRDLNSVSFVDTNNGWAVGSSGTILHTANGGSSWSPQTSGSTAVLQSVNFVDAGNGWAVGAAGTILHTTNGGASWSPQTSGSTAALQSVSFVDFSNGRAAGLGGVILRTGNGGANWSPQTSGTSSDLFGVTFTDVNNGWAVGGSGAILHTSTGGASWSPQTSGTTTILFGVSFVDAQNGWAVGAAGAILHTSNGGTNWGSQSSATGNDLHSVSFVNSPGWAVGMNGAIVHTGNGSTWSVQNSGMTKGTLFGVSFADLNNGWAVGASPNPLAVILHTSNGGGTWSPQSSGTSNQLNAVTFVDPNNGWAVGRLGTILHTSNGGGTWSPQISGTTGELFAVTFVDANNGWAIGTSQSSALILHTSNGGASWSTQISGATHPLTTGTFVDANNGWAGDEFGAIYHTSNGGATWSPQTSGVAAELTGMSFVDINNGWIVANNGQAGGILHTSNGGSTWSFQIQTVPLSGVSFVDANTGWAVGSTIILHTGDGGATWLPQNPATDNPLFAVSFVRASAPATPSLSVGKTHNGTFTQGMTAEWDVMVNNGAGSPATTGATTVSDTLPTGYTVNNFSTTDPSWGCSGIGTQTATCTSTSAVNGGGTFPTVNIVVNIPANSPASVMNTAKAFGGGDTAHATLATAASGSDTVSVGTPVPSPSLSVVKTHNGAFTLGGAGEWDVSVSNAAGSSVTTAATTVSDTLPGGYTVSGFSTTDPSWSCSGTGTQTATCISTSVVNGGSGFPPVKIIVNVPANSPATVINTAKAFGGGDTVHFSLDTAALGSDAVQLPPAQLRASATISPSQVNGTTYHYSLVLRNTGSTTIGAFWFSWIPGLDFMPVSPSNLTSPASWTAAITHAGAIDGYAIQWVASSPGAYLAAGQSLTGFSFDSTMTPTQLAGLSGINSAYPVLTTFVYIGSPLGDAGFQFLPAVAQQLVPVTPCRLMDTRGANGTFGGPFLAGGATRGVPVPSSACGIPSSALAYALNITVVPRGATLGFLTVWPSGQTQPAVSTLNSPDGAIVSNAAIVPVGTGGAINVFATDNTDLIVDINAYFTNPGNGALQFYPLAPCRVIDTRGPAGMFGAPALAGGNSRPFPIPSSPCGAPASAQAYSFNVTIVPTGFLGFLTAWPSGQTQPGVSTLNSLDGSIRAVAAIVPAGTGGAVSFFATNDTNLVVDINGYFAPPSVNGLNFFTVAPCRVADTRNPVGPLGGPSLSGGSTRDFPLAAGVCQLPAAAAAYSLNMTVVPQGPLGFLTMWPAGLSQPVVSTLNGPKGIVVANAAIVPAGTGGDINAFVTNMTGLVVDTNGYFGH